MGLLGIASGIGSAAAAYGVAGDISQAGANAANQMGELAGQLQTDTGFKGYGVTTGLGTSNVRPDGTTNIGVGPDANMMASGQQGMAGGSAALGDAFMMNQMSGGFNPYVNENAQQLQNMNSYNSAGSGAYSLFNSAAQGLGQNQGGALAASQEAMNQSMGSTAARERSIYNRAMAMQQPALDAQRAQQQAREYAMGRGGVRGSQFGGTAEDAAMARAQAQASNEAAFQAMGQAQTEKMNQGALANMYGQLGQNAAGLQGQLGSQLNQAGLGNAQLGQAAGMNMSSIEAQRAQLGQSQASLAGQLGGQMFNQGLQGYQTSYLPMEQQMMAMQLGGQNADRFQSGQFTGANLAAQLGLGGIQTQANMEKAASELYGNVFGAGMNALGSMSGMLGGLGASNGGFLPQWLADIL